MTEPSFGTLRDWLLRFAPREQRTAIAAVFEIEAGVLESLRAGVLHEVAHARLEWWQQELERLAHAEPRHPAARRLDTEARAIGASPPELRGLLDYARVELAGAGFMTREELDAHARHWALSVFRAVALADAATVGGETRAAAERLASEAGPALCELEWLDSFSRDARRGRVHWPLGDPPSDHTPWTARPLGARELDALRERRKEVCGTLIAAAHRPQAALRPALRVALLWIALAVAEARGDADVFDDDARRRARQAGPWRLTMRAWRAAFALSRQRMPEALERHP